jgi:hypothetical protein
MKQEMLDLLQRCADIIQGEIDLLTQWSNSGAISPSGKAGCRQTIIYISSGETSSQVQVQNIIDKANQLNDAAVTSAPSKDAVAVVVTLEKNLQNRQGWNGPSLEESWFESALSQAEDNAAHAADCAANIFSECT